jgi:hypothetical protein
MPLIKSRIQGQGLIEIPYFLLVFKGDIIKIGDTVQCVEKFDAYLDFHFKEVSIFIKTYGYQQLNRPFHNYYLLKRPLMNWFKYLRVLITKRYFHYRQKKYLVYNFENAHCNTIFARNKKEAGDYLRKQFGEDFKFTLKVDKCRK